MVFQPKADGSAEGMVIEWKNEMFEVQAIEFGIFSLSAKLKN